MKTCTRCKISKPLNEFGSYSASSDGKYYVCLGCDRAKQRDYYLRNKTSSKARSRRNETPRRNKIKQQALEYLEVHPCVDCKENDPVVLEFDHVRGEKSAGVCDLVRWGRSWATVQAEIDKCDVRCANCHRRKTAKERGWFRSLGLEA